MLQRKQNLPVAEELLGDLDPLIEHLGSFDQVASAIGSAEPSSVHRITTPDGLRSFLRNYHFQILQPFELPAILRAFNHGSRNELRELISFDHQLSAEPALKNFAAASRRVGQQQLQRLRPLRDLRLVQHYLDAVEKGEAHGWHTLIYGVSLAVYSLPLRQGLMGYAEQTTRGFIRSAARSFPLPQYDARTIYSELAACFPAAVESLLTQSLAA